LIKEKYRRQETGEKKEKGSRLKAQGPHRKDKDRRQSEDRG